MDNSSSSSSGEEEPEVVRLERCLKELEDNKIASETRFTERINGERKKSKFLIAELIAARTKLAQNNKKQKATIALSRHEKNEVVVALPPQGVQPAGKAPEDIFPLEVWGIIFEKLKKPQDLTNCSNANRAWRKELEPKRTQFLFEQVLPILINNNFFPAKQLFEQILELRHVCHLWRKGVDSFLENHPCHYHLDEGCTRPNLIYPPHSSGFDCYRTTYSYNFPSPDFIQHGDYEYNQQLPRRCAGQGLFCHGRSLTVSEFHASRTRVLPAFWNGVRDLLSQVGEHIWYLKIDGEMAIEEELRAVLKLVPNLKVLCATFSRNDPPLTSPEPLPPLPKLEVLKVPSLRENPPFIHQLLSTYTHIKKLGMGNLEGVPNAQLEENARNQLLDEITRPNLEAYCAPPTVCESSTQLRRFLSYYPTLNSVSLQVPHFESGGFQELLNELGMRRQVKTLNLKLAVQKFGGNAQFQNMLILPDLQNLVINTGKSFGLVSIDCILPLKSLRKLTVVGVDLGGIMRMRSNTLGGTMSVRGVRNSSHPRSPREAAPKPTDEELGNVINFLGFEQRLYESNVWKLMPQLEQVLLKDRFTNGEGEKPCYYYEHSGYDQFWERETNQNLTH